VTSVLDLFSVVFIKIAYNLTTTGRFLRVLRGNVTLKSLADFYPISRGNVKNNV